VFYPVAIFLDKPLLYNFESYNPLFLFMDTARNSIMGAYPTYHPLFSDPRELILAPLMAIGMFIIGWLFFTRMEGKFAYYF
jgi:ABC-type polysaccharide/polyol phosphate export permease